MTVNLRTASSEDAGPCGDICYTAFAAFAESHNFPADFPSPEIATELLAGMIVHDEIFGVVAEDGGRIVGSNFLDLRNPIAGVGPITVDPASQNRSVGRALMDAVIQHARAAGVPGIRLVQAAYHGRSLSLYAKLGFEVREPLACLQGAPLYQRVSGHEVRPGRSADIEPCNALCRRVHGHDRGGELRDAIEDATAQVVERDGRITGYTTQIAFFGHTVCEADSDLMALIGAADAFGGPGFLLPTRNAGVFKWCLERGLRVVQPLTLMSSGLYNTPRGAFMPSVVY